MGRKIRHSKRFVGRRRRFLKKSEKISANRRSAAELLEPRVVLNGDPVISEFQADNATTLRDGNGEFSDWIEVRNPDTAQMDISGYFLTDDDTELRKWQFPDNTVLEPGEHRVIFASSDDKMDLDGNLHTNFALNRNGEFLALVKPDGLTVVQSFDEYPAQLEDQSFGVASDRDTTVLFEKGSDIRTFVPTDDSLGTTWTSPGFDDAGWMAGQTAVGYEVLQQGASVNDPFDTLGPEWTTDLPNGANGTVNVTDGNLVLNVPQGEQLGYDVRGTAPMVYRDLPSNEAVDFEIITHVTKDGSDDGAAGIVVVDKNTGAPAIQVEYTEDLYFRLYSGGLEQADRRDRGEDVFFLRLLRDGIEKTWTGFHKKNAEDDWRVLGTVADGENNTPELTNLAVGVYAHGDGGTMNARFSEIDIIVPDQRPVYAPQTSLDVGAMKGVNSSIYMRVPFNVDGDPARFDELSMTARYDDGFKAYLNGTLIAERNVPLDATWNSAAAGSFGAVGGTIPREEILLGSFIDQLQAGQNVLAIHAMNVSVDDNDLFFDARSIASEILGESIQFFVNPTPGSSNEMPAAPAPQIVGEDGIYFGETSIELSVDGENLQIRYTLDGSDPDEDSPVYSAPIMINESAMLQARAFDTSDDPEFIPSNPTNGTYFILEESLRGRSSDLPIILLDSLGQSLPNTGSTDLRPVNVIVIDVSKATGRATLEEGKIDYLGRGGVRDRGSSSAGRPKPQMAFETWGPGGTDKDDDENINVLGMGADSDWVFYAANNFDPIQLHNQYAFDLSNQIGQWAPDYRNVELFFNRNTSRSDVKGAVGTEDYYGVYAIHEKVTRGSHRVDVASIDPSVTKTPEEALPGEPNISGGYIWKIDRGDPGESAFSAGGASLNWVYPKSPSTQRARPDQKATRQQEQWIQGYLGDLRDALRDPNFDDPEGYTKYIDLESWAEHHLHNVLTFNVDAYRLSGYINKDRDSKIVYGPVWDFDRALNSTDGRDANPLVWRSETGDRGTNFFGAGSGMQWLSPLFQRDVNWWQYYIDTWHELRDVEFSEANLHALVDKLADEIRESQARERAECGSTHCREIRPRGGWENEVRSLKTWLSDRSGFIDGNFAPVPFFKSGEDVLARTESGLNVTAGHQTEIHPIVTFNEDTPIVDGTNGAIDASYFVPVNDDLGDTWTANDFDDGAWQTGKLGVGFGDSTGFEDNYTTRIRPNEVNEDATNVFVRIPFTLDNLDGLDKLVLQMKYDDGFVAHLNGEEIIEQNLREPAAWDARAGNRRNREAVEFEDFDISEHADKLKVGENMLAIRIVNSSRTSGDLLMLPQLVKRKVSFGAAPTGTVYYTTDGTDPRGRDGMPSASAIELERGATITINSNTRVIARNLDDSDRGSESRIVLSDWSGPTTVDYVVDRPELVISEVNYNPGAATRDEQLAGFGNDDFEFIEIHNPTNQVADLIGTKLSDGVAFDFYSVASLEAGGYGVVVRNAEAFEVRYGDQINVLGVYDGTLSNAGEDIDLVDGAGEVIFSVNYGDNDPWPARADGFGASLELADPAVTLATQSKWYSWRGSSEYGGSPGRAGDGPVGVVVNEVISHTDGPVNLTDSIELHNTTNAPIDIGGWKLSDDFSRFNEDDRGTPTPYDDLEIEEFRVDKFTIPLNTIIPAGGYVTFSERDFNIGNPVGDNVNFALSGDRGDDVWLTITDAAGKPQTFVDDVHFRETINGESIGRIPNGSGRLVPLTRTTFDADNATPRVGPVIIQEIQYNPKVSQLALSQDPNLDASDLEYVTVHNPTGAEVDLTDWRLRGGVDYNFEDGAALASGETVYVLKFDPSDPEQINQLNAFKAHYGLDENVRLLGGYGGQLNNSDDRIMLLRPDRSPDDRPNAIPRPVEDEVLYDDLAPWPVQADGTGRALVRVSNDAFGSFGSSWVAGELPASLSSELRGDFNGDTVVNAADINLLGVQLRSANPDVAFDLTNDALVNSDDLRELVLNILETTFGDSNLDGTFNSGDLVVVFAAGEYEDGDNENSTWETGDWDGDGDFTTSDLVVAFREGGYSPAARQNLDADGLIGAALADGAVDTQSAHEAERLVAIGQPQRQADLVDFVDESIESLFDDDDVFRKNDSIDGVADALVDDGLKFD